MQDYHRYTTSDFISDPFFRSWVLDHEPNARVFWEEWIQSNKYQSEEIEEARAVLLTLQEKKLLTDDKEVERQIQLTLNRIKDKSENNIEVTSRPIYLLTYMRWAAGIVLAFGLGWSFFQYMQSVPEPGITKINILKESTDGSLMKYNNTLLPLAITLDDNSTVVLQPKSELRYPDKFTGAKRIVSLKGEAFFQVTKNANKPFIVLTEELVTEVLGTSFTVRSFEKDKSASVSVKTGRVSVHTKLEELSIKKSDSKEVAGVILTPNQQAVFKKDLAHLVKTVVTNPIRIPETPAPVLAFDEAPVKQVFETLEKEYGIEILFNSETLSACFLTANLSGLTLYEQMDLICKVIKARYEIIDAQIIIHSSGCNTAG